MRLRRQNLMANNAFLGAIYMDRRFNFDGSVELNQEQKTNAVNLKYPNDIDSLTPEISPSTSIAENLENSNKYRKLEELMRIKNNNTKVGNNLKKGMRQKLTLLCDESQLSIDSDILDFWKKHKKIDRDLWQLSQIMNT
ncbi:hypothetical protein ABEB36_013979 [Hypothenemus hampei]|uniref:Uncharacterized protein n=1 Tax=Hypothenemus hampei TaxID=57062 RepID=A0ABD1E5N9_HYPHA